MIRSWVKIIPCSSTWRNQKTTPLVVNRSSCASPWTVSQKKYLHENSSILSNGTLEQTMPKASNLIPSKDTKLLFLISRVILKVVTLRRILREGRLIKLLYQDTKFTRSSLNCTAISSAKYIHQTPTKDY